MLEATHTCNSQDKNSSNAPLSTHRHDAVVKHYHTSSHLWCYCCCPSGFLQVSLSCRETLSEHNASIGRDSCRLCRCPAAKALLDPKSRPYPPLNLVCPQPCPEVSRTVHAIHMVQQKGSQHVLGDGNCCCLCFRNTGFHLAGTTKKREQTLPGSTELVSPC